MVVFQLVGAAVQFGVAEMVQSRIGLWGVLLMTVAAVGIRARNTAMTCWAVTLFVVLMTQA
ncbi:hypothetical protein ABT173_08930 [Streptomyces sp. NPDC001795]|uniref:hypothetical protein n=1 Tax=unclassified Streptomyces TaxID=2593676 RepID=UPI00332E48BD